MPFATGNLTRWHFTGDSITSLANLTVGNWPGYPGSIIDQARAQNVAFAPVQTNTYVPARLNQIAQPYSPLPTTGRRQVCTVYGVGGRVIAGLQADLPASIYVWQPDILFLEIGTNDFGFVTDVSPGGAFQTSYNAVLDGVHTNLPRCKVLCFSPPIRSEAWTAGSPPHLNDGLDTWAGLTRIQESVSARNTFCEYVDVLTPAFALTRTLQPVAGSSVTPKYLTQDSLHPSLLGRQVMAAATLPHLIFS